MKARVQYNDYVGTAAADFADSSSIEGCLKEKGVNTERYEPIGVKFFSGYTNYFNVRFICIDRQSEERKAIYIDFEKKISQDEFFNLFKRLEVILTKKGGVDYSKWELSEDAVTIDDRE